MSGHLFTAWILGSGFSKCLGGPLLADLLSDRSGGEARARLQESTLDRDPPPDYGLVYKVFAEHQRGNDASRGKAVHWDHAEEFLTFVDSSDSNSVRRRLLKEWLPSEWQTQDGTTNFRRHAVQAVAAECHFLYAAAVKEDEAWLPYIRWASGLDPETNAIISFNYDMVLERLGSSGGVKTLGRGTVLIPEEPQAKEVGVPIYKLHGSVDWFRDQYDVFKQNQDFVLAVKQGMMPLIGTPGMSKRKVKNGLLKAIWDKAEQALRRAAVVVFLGYRSPPSDPDARAFILDALSSPDPGVPNDRRVHLVLGPNTNDPAIVRMEKLLQFAMEAKGRIERSKPGHSPPTGRFEILKQPLIVEDFPCGIHERELFGS